MTDNETGTANMATTRTDRIDSPSYDVVKIPSASPSTTSQERCTMVSTPPTTIPLETPRAPTVENVVRIP